MAKKKQILQGKDISHGRLFIYLLLVIVAVFMISKLDITGMATKINLTPTITAGDNLYMTVDSGSDKLDQEFDIYRYKENGQAVRFIDNYGSICRESACMGKNQITISTLDNWEEGKYSIRVYDWRAKTYTEVFFFVKEKYPAVGPAVHR